MDAEFEARIRELNKEVYPRWSSGEITNLPRGRFKDNCLMVVYLTKTLNYLHNFEKNGFNCTPGFHPNPIFSISVGRYLEYGDLGISQKEAKKFLRAIHISQEKQTEEQHLNDVIRVIEIERRIFELTR